MFRVLICWAWPEGCPGAAEGRDQFQEQTHAGDELGVQVTMGEGNQIPARPSGSVQTQSVAPTPGAVQGVGERSWKDRPFCKDTVRGKGGRTCPGWCSLQGAGRSWPFLEETPAIFWRVGPARAQCWQRSSQSSLSVLRNNFDTKIFFIYVQFL